MSETSIAAAKAVTDAMVLLRTGRANKALTALERLEEPAQLVRLEAETRELADRIERQYRELDRLTVTIAERSRELDRLMEKRLELTRRPATPPHEALVTALISGRITAERVSELLRISPANVLAIACGRVGISAGSWRRVLRELEGAA